MYGTFNRVYRVITLAGLSQTLQIITDANSLGDFIEEFEQDFYCKLCSYTSKRRRNLERHLNTVHTKERVSCSVCFKTFKSQRSLNTHLKTIHGIPKFPNPQMAYIPKST